MVRLLLVEDDDEIALLLERFLTQYHIEVQIAASLEAARQALTKEAFDLVLLDLGLPDGDGLDLCRQIVSTWHLPVIISSARSDTSDKVVGLELGADDYLPKPYDPRELVARIHSVLRRSRSLPRQESLFQLDESKMVITLGGQPLDLTLAEYEILALFLKRPGFVLSREYIANNVSSIRWESSERSIDVVISRIRRKISDNPKNPKYIKSIKGVGYKFLETPHESPLSSF
ncbi:MAG: response regulator transcription factor [Campylobacterales bacterium]